MHIRKYLEEHSYMHAFQGAGWEMSEFHDGYLQKQLLDAVSSEIPIYIWDSSLHMAWVNSKALELAGITRDTPNPENGIIVKDDMGEPAGTLIDMATKTVENALPPLSVSEKKALLLAFQNLEHSLGVTGHMCAFIEPHSVDYTAYRELIAEGKLKMYTQLAFYMSPET